jgi:plasmid maintenance system antidote protein VapI
MKLNIDNVELARARMGVTVEQLAKSYGVSRARMNVILNQRTVTPLCAGRLAKALAVDVTEIID